MSDPNPRQPDPEAPNSPNESSYGGPGGPTERLPNPDVQQWNARQQAPNWRQREQTGTTIGAGQPPRERRRATQPQATQPNAAGQRNPSGAAPAGSPRGGVAAMSSQDIQLWLQRGGWRIVAGVAAVLLVLLIVFLALSRSEQRNRGFVSEEVGSTSGVGSSPLLVETSGLPLSTPIPPTAVPATLLRYEVFNTGGLGLFLRQENSTDSIVLTTLPDGTVVQEIAPAFTGPDRVWRNVRTDSGQEGWVAADFLRPAP